ncbi:hypothetical protein B7R78_0021935 [Ralstonia solanacearum]|uniref:Uncharacterized protein n=1 Tax=Ralstonia solanacearum K60 TaxID=1091042 RepID=A0AAP7ZHY6_RALSL|nr:hypothetical protein [Ralstonia solanacearum]MBT1539640.1 hypothetical protein [Ralstonia solanacearum]OYQ09390.1 hypothetical protein B7R77_20925 [Ralstonia solanacearum K60]QOK84158.1 hypothetical protein HF906_18700 [Ralstonia solanacearum]RIJ84682.1 hypothetical protein RSP822_20050 [Ralstonia solanacearum]
MMRIKLSIGAGLPMRRFPLQSRIAAVRTRLTLRRRALVRGHQRVAARANALDRVMRRTAVHISSAFTAHVRPLALRPGSVIRHTERVDVRHGRTPGLPVVGTRQQIRFVMSQRTLHERLIERLTHAQATTVVPAIFPIARAEQREMVPRIQMVMVRGLPPEAKTATATTGSMIPALGEARVHAPQPRFAPPAPPLVLPPQELSRLTDHVIRQLDHRVLSWQERTGRI